MTNKFTEEITTATRRGGGDHQRQATTQLIHLPSGLRGSEAKAKNGGEDRKRRRRTGTKAREEAIGALGVE